MSLLMRQISDFEEIILGSFLFALDSQSVYGLDQFPEGLYFQV
jgi:hypothetical protein